MMSETCDPHQLVGAEYAEHMKSSIWINTPIDNLTFELPSFAGLGYASGIAAISN